MLWPRIHLTYRRKTCFSNDTPKQALRRRGVPPLQPSPFGQNHALSKDDVVVFVLSENIWGLSIVLLVATAFVCLFLPLPFRLQRRVLGSLISLLLVGDLRERGLDVSVSNTESSIPF